MSQWLDLQTPGGNGVDPVPMQTNGWPSAEYGNGAGFAQMFTALGTGYLARRLDIDLQGRMLGMQPDVAIRGTGPRQNVSGTIPGNRGNGAAEGINWGGLLPIAAIGVAALLWARS